MTVAEPGAPWWARAVMYQVYLRSFADSDGDGLGDLAGVRARLPHLASLGVDGIWLNPFYPSPQVDHGYDVADPRAVDPAFGDLAGFDALLADAHALGIRVLVDIVPNHSSDRHPWFAAALAAPPGSPLRARYHFFDGRGDAGELPPNNWLSVFGGVAWTRVADGQWYLHLFTPGQPDLNWARPDVGDDYEATLRFWLDRGVDGFRIDVAHGLAKDARLRDNPLPAGPYLLQGPERGEEIYTWDQPEVHAVYRRWRRILGEYPGERTAVGEVWVRTVEARARYLRPDELHAAFNFHLLTTGWDAAALRAVIDASTGADAAVGAPTTWVLSNHDVVRHPTRYGWGDAALGLRRARAAALLYLALPGAAYVYQGEELGLPEVDVPARARQDPIFLRTGGALAGRDGCRVPLPWSGAASPYGFAPPGAEPWLPMPPDWAGFTVQAQEADPDSTLWLYRRAIALRRRHPPAGNGAVAWRPAPDGVLAFDRAPGLRCWVNLSGAPVPLPAGEVLLASVPTAGGLLADDAAAWLGPDPARR